MSNGNRHPIQNLSQFSLHKIVIQTYNRQMMIKFVIAISVLLNASMARSCCCTKSTHGQSSQTCCTVKPAKTAPKRPVCPMCAESGNSSGEQQNASDQTGKPAPFKPCQCPAAHAVDLVNKTDDFRFTPPAIDLVTMDFVVELPRLLTVRCVSWRVCPARASVPIYLQHCRFNC